MAQRSRLPEPVPDEPVIGDEVLALREFLRGISESERARLISGFVTGILRAPVPRASAKSAS